jgi:soluble cytochrome b562
LEIESTLNEVYAGCYDKAVLFSDLITYRKKERFLHIKPVKKISKNEYLVSADGISDVVKWNLVKFESDDRVDFYREFRDYWIDGNFLVVLMSNKIAIYDLEKEVILNDNFKEVLDADKIVIFDKYMLVSDIRGIVYKFDLFEDEEKLVDFILKEDFKSAYELIDKNPFLRRSGAFERLEKYVELLIKRAKNYFEVDREKAVEILQKLLVVPHLRTKIEQIIKDFEQIVKFKFAIKTGNYALAYQLANQYPLLKETKYYQLLEKKWQITFEKALKLIKEGKISQAKEILEPFMAVPSKLPLIEFALKKAQIIFLLKEKLAKRDFKGFFDLIKTHPELKETLEYQKVMEYAKRVLQKAKELFEKEEFEKAKKAATILLDFPDYEVEARKLLKKIEIALVFQAALANKDYEKAYELVELYPFLKKLSSYKKFMQDVHSSFKEAERLMHENKKYEALQKVKDFQNRFTMERITNLSEI